MIKTSERSPSKSGYYYCKYFNSPKNDWFFKSLWYDATDKMWTGIWPWCIELVIDEPGRRLYKHLPIEVEEWLEESFSPYYAPSTIAAMEYLSKNPNEG